MSIKVCGLVLSALLIAGCAQPEPKSQENFTLSKESTPWTAATMSQPGSVKMQISPAFESYTALRFYERGDIDNKENFLAQIVFTGEQCSDGYEIVLNHEAEDLSHHFLRSEVLPWNRPVNLTVSWRSSDELTVSAGDFEETVELKKMPNQLVLVTYRGKADVDYIHFQSAE